MKEETQKQYTIMVIEDEDLLLKAIDMKLVANGYRTLTCASAKQALDYLQSIDEKPDLIWLDYYLEDMNGMAFMQEIKKHPQWSKIPVIVVSNSASEEKRKQMTELGVKQYLLKAKYRLDDIIAIARSTIEGK